MHRCITPSALAFIFAAGTAQAQDGLLDPSFGLSGSGRNIIAHDQGGEGADTSAGVLVAPNGLIYLVGTAQIAAGSRHAITRLTRDGIRDPSFGVEGTVYSTAADLTARRARLDAAGNLLIAGHRTISATRSEFHLCRYDPQGQPLPFAGAGSACISIDFDAPGQDRFAVAHDLLIEPSGRIVLAGSAAMPGGTSVGAVARLRADGTLDPDFGDAGTRVHQFGPVPVTRFNAIDRTAAGTYVAVGEFGNPISENGTSAVVAMLTVGGDTDPAFQGGAGYAGLPIDGGEPFNRSEAATAVHVQRDGSILTAGSTQIGESSDRYGVFVYKILPAAVLTLDDGFGSKGRVLIEDGYSMAIEALLVQTDGHIAMVGSRRPEEAVVSLDMAVLRLRPNGTPDPGFGSNGRTYLDFGLQGEFDFGTRVATQAGRLIVAGHSLRLWPQNFDLTIARLGNERIFAEGLD